MPKCNPSTKSYSKVNQKKLLLIDDILSEMGSIRSDVYQSMQIMNSVSIKEYRIVYRMIERAGRKLFRLNAVKSALKHG